jgi:hypothetical protein
MVDEGNQQFWSDNAVEEQRAPVQNFAWHTLE